MDKIIHITISKSDEYGMNRDGVFGKQSVGGSWGNLFEEKVSPNPFQNLFGRWLPVCLAYIM
ncbi:MAG: hypothetical protein J6C42_04970, partial [Clostridia bacterium]|nr:hypothetical protein [Clostridia bacterium]